MIPCTKHLIHRFLQFFMALHLASVASFEVKLILNVNTVLITSSRYQIYGFCIYLISGNNRLMSSNVLTARQNVSKTQKYTIYMGYISSKKKQIKSKCMATRNVSRKIFSPLRRISWLKSQNNRSFVFAILKKKLFSYWSSWCKLCVRTEKVRWKSWQIFDMHVLILFFFFPVAF